MASPRPGFRGLPGAMKRPGTDGPSVLGQEFGKNCHFHETQTNHHLLNSLWTIHTSNPGNQEKQRRTSQSTAAHQ